MAIKVSQSWAHGPAPWFVSKKCPIGSTDMSREEFYVYSLQGNIATVPTDVVLHLNSDAEANAHLIAAAPELLEKLKYAIDFLPIRIAKEIDQTVIAKAEGRA